MSHLAAELLHRDAVRPHLRFGVLTPANDCRCSGCGQQLCGCPDAVFMGVLPPSVVGRGSTSAPASARNHSFHDIGDTRD